jgi:uncharacterized protein
MATTEQPPVTQARVRSTRVRISRFIVNVQLLLFVVHLFLYETWTFFHPETNLTARFVLRLATILLSVSFVSASLLAHRYWNITVRIYYRIAALWLGFLNFFFLAACLSWLAYVVVRVLSLPVARSEMVTIPFSLAILVGVYGVLNARWLRVKRISVELPNLPASWRGRTAAVVSDVHLGHVNGAAFSRRIVAKLNGLHPDIVFLPGDLFDGSKADLDGMVAPWKELSSPFGAYFITGNHEEFSDRDKYLRAVTHAGICVLNSEKVIVDGLQIVGVHYSESSYADHFRSVLESVHPDRRRASILLTHVPHGLGIAEDAGISLQISGHTHGGQIFPFTWLTHRMFGEYTYGLARFAELSVYTSCGAGTWGPPLRVGTRPEIVLIKFR